MRITDHLCGLGLGVLLGLLAPAGLLGAGPATPASGPVNDIQVQGSHPIEIKVPATEGSPQSVSSWLEAQIALARGGISCGPIDGVGGLQSVVALQAYQESKDLPATGLLDEATRAQLVLTSPALTQVTLTGEDLARLQPLSPTWLGKSQQTALDYESALELVAERAHASQALVRRLNPAVDWTRPAAGTILTVPAIGRLKPAAVVAHLHIYLSAHVLEARDAAGGLIAHFPVSIARMAEKRPEGELHVTVVIANPNYTFDPDVFPESAEGRELGRKLVVPPGPNNPVGVAWIGLDLPGYGIHGTPVPEQVGRTESHGCFRLANWDALTLLDLAWVGLPVVVDP
jgi:lipoprotein-anchoring transpeptidase ErfK/SrfK